MEAGNNIVGLYFKYGIRTGLAAFAWLIGEYLTGLHTKYFEIFFIVTQFSMLIPILGLVLFYKRLRKSGILFWSPGKACMAGIYTSFIAGIVAAIGQWLYHLLINPSYFETMIELASRRGGGDAASYFNTSTYVISAFFYNFILGTLTSLITVLATKKKIISPE